MQNSDVENYLVSYLLAVSYAEIEEKIKTILERRSSKSNDKHVSQYIISNHKNNTGRIAISDITSLLARFGDDYKMVFMGSVLNKPTHAAWDNIILNRHKVTHGSGVIEMTILEFEKALQGSKDTLIELANAFSLTLSEISDLI